MFLDFKKCIHTDYLPFKRNPSFIKCLFCASYIPDSVLGLGDTAVNETKQRPVGFFSLVNEVGKQKRQMKGKHFKQ